MDQEKIVQVLQFNKKKCVEIFCIPYSVLLVTKYNDVLKEKDETIKEMKEKYEQIVQEFQTFKEKDETIKEMKEKI